MNRLGMIVRADSGGLGSQTWEIWRHLRPERTLVALATDAQARGHQDALRYSANFTETLHSEHGLRFERREYEWLTDGVDVVFTVESPYRKHGFRDLNALGVDTALLANPELFSVVDHDWPTHIYCPTTWSMDRMPEGRCRLLRQPVATDRFKSRVRDECTTFFHPSAPAMLDRNGTHTVIEALEYVTTPCKLIVATNDERHLNAQRARYGCVDVEFRPQDHANYWDGYPDEADVLVLPRRYGGLCLPALEAAAQGMPALMTHLSPQEGWPGVISIPVRGRETHSMKGGEFAVWDANPRTLGQCMNDILNQPAAVKRRSELALRWAADNSWDALLPDWMHALRGVVG